MSPLSCVILGKSLLSLSFPSPISKVGFLISGNVVWGVKRGHSWEHEGCLEVLVGASGPTLLRQAWLLSSSPRGGEAGIPGERGRSQSPLSDPLSSFLQGLASARGGNSHHGHPQCWPHCHNLYLHLLKVTKEGWGSSLYG